MSRMRRVFAETRGKRENASPTHDGQADGNSDGLEAQEKPEAAVVPLSYARPNHDAVMVVLGDAAIAQLAVLGAEWLQSRVQTTHDSGTPTLARDALHKP